MGGSRDKWTSLVATVVINTVLLPYYLIGAIRYMIAPPHVARRPCPLVEAIERGDPTEVRALLAEGADPNARQTQTTVRHWSRSVRLDIPPATAKPALTLAAAGNHKEIVELLLDAGAEIDARVVGQFETVSGRPAGGAGSGTLVVGQFELLRPPSSELVVGEANAQEVDIVGVLLQGDVQLA